MMSTTDTNALPFPWDKIRLPKQWNPSTMTSWYTPTWPPWPSPGVVQILIEVEAGHQSRHPSQQETCRSPKLSSWAPDILRICKSVNLKPMKDRTLLITSHLRKGNHVVHLEFTPTYQTVFMAFIRQIYHKQWRGHGKSPQHGAWVLVLLINCSKVWLT